MERLQAAIEKARAQREDRFTRNTVSTQAARPNSAAGRAEAAEAVWLAVPEIKLRSKQLHSKRVLAFQGGPTAAPYDILRTRLTQQAHDNGWHRIAIVSPHSGTGKTTATANLAFGLARQRNIRSVVMDMDLRRSGLGKLLGQQGHIPMSSVLEGQVPFSDIARRYGKNLIFGLGFGISPNPSEVLQSPQSQKVLKEIEATYAPDFMIFDMPPLSASDDNLGFLTQVDAALIVAEAEKTTLDQIDVAERQVAELTNVMGIILNKCRYMSNTYGYEEGYY